MSAALKLFAREAALAWGRGGGPLVSVGFYAGVATLIPLATGPEAQRLAAVAAGVAWVALALASLLSLERLFERDYEDGALDLLVLSPVPLEHTCAAKCLGQWLAAGAPLGRFAWGGGHERLPAGLRAGSAAAIAIYAVMAVIVLQRARLVGLLPDQQLAAVGIWVIVGYLGLGVVMNAISRSRAERFTMTPVALALCLLALAVALETTG